MIPENLTKLKSLLQEEQQFLYACRLLEYDKSTVCPSLDQQYEGSLQAQLMNSAFQIRSEKDFIDAAQYLYEHRDALNEWDRCLAEQLHREYLREKNITPARQLHFDEVKSAAWVAWSRAKEASDFSLFADALAKVRDVELERMSLWESEAPETTEEDDGLFLYGRMLEENERGITIPCLDALFEECVSRIGFLLRTIEHSSKRIRTDFLSRPVTDEQQRALADYLLHLIGFDFTRGTYGVSEHPFTSLIGRDDIRLTTNFRPNNFLASLYSILHEGGHALFEQNQPRQNHDYFLSGGKTMGQHESVSRFYENIIGRSKAFIRLIYPKVCEIFPQVMADVTEEELYEAVNAVSPSLIRLHADELTYTLHIVIRYRIEKQLIAGELAVEEIPAQWSRLYEEYLGITPSDDRDGALQDVHWTENFGYFPTYALGNFYNAMYYRKMQEDFDVEEAVENGDFARINDWMKQHVFAKADRLSPSEWIRDITGRELTAEDFLSYLEEKYLALYQQDENVSRTNHAFEEYVKGMSKIRMLSSPRLTPLDNAESYSVRLHDSFLHISSLAEENRRMLDETLFPLLASDGELTAQMVEDMQAFSDLLANSMSLENLDIPILLLLTERLMKDAESKADDSYIVRQLDESIIVYYSLMIMTSRIAVNTKISEHFRRKGFEAARRLLTYLEPERLLALSPEAQYLVVRDARYHTCLYGDTMGILPETAHAYLRDLESAMQIYQDDDYHRRLPDINWDYVIFRTLEDHGCVLEYLYETNTLSTGDFDRIATCLKQEEALWRSDPEHYAEYSSYDYVLANLCRGLYYNGEISKEEYRTRLMEIYGRRNRQSYDFDSVYLNLKIPFSYILTIDPENPNEEEKALLQTFYQDVCSYAFHMPNSGTLTSLLEYFSVILMYFIEVPGGITFEDMCLRALAAFHPPTYVHSLTVAQLSRCLGAYLLQYQPELFLGVCGCSTTQQVHDRQNRILHDIYHAALCHDFGKLPMIDTIFVYGRKLLDFEFDIIREHPDMGAFMMRRHHSTREYADVARGHHKWYDNTAGYPAGFDIRTSPLYTVISIVECADCMDAATDSIGRSYNKGKNLDSFLSELREGRGTRYAPFLADLLERQEVQEELNYVLSKGRQDNYRSTYLLLREVQDTGETT